VRVVVVVVVVLVVVAAAAAAVTFIYFSQSVCMNSFSSTYMF
jgi:hypothetical protein